jgi:hypothetical protein
MSYAKVSKEIVSVIENYFEGIYKGDIELLRSVFHRDTLLFGDIKGYSYQKNVDDYLAVVANRKNPKEIGELFQMKILSVEVLGTIAFVKVHVPMLGYNYYDYLSLLKFNQQWKIVSKLFTHVD